MSNRNTKETKRYPDIILEGKSPYRLPWNSPKGAEPEWVEPERRLDSYLQQNAKFVDQNKKTDSTLFHFNNCTIRQYWDLREAEQRVQGRDHFEYVMGVEIYGTLQFSESMAERLMDAVSGYLKRVKERK